MVTVVNNPQPASEGEGGMGFLLGVVLLIVVAIIFIYYGLPAIRNVSTTPQINVPEKIDVNVNQGQ